MSSDDNPTCTHCGKSIQEGHEELCPQHPNKGKFTAYYCPSFASTRKLPWMVKRIRGRHEYLSSTTGGPRRYSTYERATAAAEKANKGLPL